MVELWTDLHSATVGSNLRQVWYINRMVRIKFSPLVQVKDTIDQRRLKDFSGVFNLLNKF